MSEDVLKLIEALGSTAAAVEAIAAREGGNPVAVVHLYRAASYARVAIGQLEEFSGARHALPEKN